MRSRRNTSFVNEIKNVPKITRVFRYCGTLSQPIQVTSTNLFQIQLGVINGNSTAITLIQSFKLDMVKMYLMPASDTDAGFGYFSWVGSRTPESVHTISFAPAVPAKFSFQPPKDSFPAMWFNIDTDTGETLFEFDCSDATVEVILDIHMTICYGNGSTGTRSITAPSFSGVACYEFSGLVPLGLESVS
jgi:hypothetical protein